MTTFRPIADAGVAFSFQQLGGSPQLQGSNVVATEDEGPSWTILFDDEQPRPVRITIQSYNSVRRQLSEAPSFFELYAGSDPAVIVTNQIPDDATEFVPNPVSGSYGQVVYTAGFGSELSRIETFSMLVEVDAAPAETCEELGRVSRCYVSAHDRSRIHDTRLYPTEKRCLVANFNGAVAKGRTIVKAEWRMQPVLAVSMANPAIDGREARVMIQAAYRGETSIKCTVTFDSGEIYTQLFRVLTLPGPFFGDEFTTGGPAFLQVTA
ncbi:hypothetical protein [Lysobacter enzymogenes]|uniref:hypothetical protein n=1 Tax=Lysobacter enzymogenes TaxID=69 RepID=UPI00089B395C|nr:hypothetical protein [Lysobacter enzymogenes]SDX52668.1 hypothetical protein SAMN05421681_10623 [Lysobacter enzymogenes]